MNYSNSNLNIQSDFLIRTIDQGNNDLDLIIPLDNRVVNLSIKPCSPSYPETFQFTQVSSIIIRYNTSPNNNVCSIHLLRSIDMTTALVNFDLSYKGLNFQIIKELAHVDFIIS